METTFDFLTHITQGCVEIARVPSIQYAYNPRKQVYQNGKVRLYHYQPKVKKPDSTPLLVVFATVNRPEILDLFPDTSFIGGLLEGGMDVYLLDWGYPDQSDKTIGLSDYVCEYLHGCVQFIRAESGQEQIHLLGICQGGLICLSYAILVGNIKNLVLISTPIDFSTDDNLVAKFLNQIHVDELVALAGNISGAWLTQFFIYMRPFELIGKKYLRFVDNLADEERTNKFLRVEKWLYDAPDQTGNAFSELIGELYQQNKLIKGEFFLAGKPVNLAELTIPVLNVMASEDEIVPVSASQSLKNYVSSRVYAERLYPSGHIGIYISDKVGKCMPKAIADWLKNPT